MKYFMMIGMTILFLACQEKKKAAVANTEMYYTCSMHPQVMQDRPGKCPICGMELIAVKKGNAQSENTIMLSDQQVQLGGIKTDTIGKGLIGEKTVLAATLNVDETKSTSVSARIAGRIEKLYFKNTGDYLHKGDKMYDLYSEELNSAKQEYLLAIENRQMLDSSIIDFKQLVESAKNKLLLWGMSELQVEELAKSKKTSPVTSFYSPDNGYIVSLESHEGDYVAEGTTILRLADLSIIWAEAQVYTTNLSAIDRGATAIVQLPDLGGKEVRGKIQFVNPEVNPATRINLIRVAIPNVNNRLKPGMPAYVVLESRQASMLMLPAGAVIRHEKQNTVWVQVDHNTYKSVIVKTGLEDNDRIEIAAGLKDGDIVVTAGAYLLNSEYIFKKGANPMTEGSMRNM